MRKLRQTLYEEAKDATSIHHFRTLCFTTHIRCRSERFGVEHDANTRPPLSRSVSANNGDDVQERISKRETRPDFII